MPFLTQTARPFTRERVESITPLGQMGVYGLYKGDRWIYIGRGDIRERLLAHLNGDNPCITREAPTHWVDEVTAAHVAREQELLREISTACNQRVG